MKSRTRAVVIPLIMLTLGATACGVPITASEITATAESAAALGVFAADPVATGVSSRAANVSLIDEQRVTATIALVAAAGRTLNGTVSPAATTSVTGTPTVTPTPGTETPTATPTVTPTPSSSIATATPVPSIAAPPSASVGDPAQLVSDAIALVNQYRVSVGDAPLRVSPTLGVAASSYAQQMGDRNFFGHNGADGSSPESRISASGYGGSFNGEALAAGQHTAADAVTTWLNSPPHAAILLDPTSTEIGIGFYYAANSYYHYYWVLETGLR